MNIRKPGILLVAIATIGFAGCPGSPRSQLAGTWILKLNGQQIGITLESNGEASSFMIENIIPGTLTRHDHGDQFVMDGVEIRGRVVYVALISEDGTRLDGAALVWSGSETGTSATFVADKTT